MAGSNLPILLVTWVLRTLWFFGGCGGIGFNLVVVMWNFGVCGGLSVVVCGLYVSVDGDIIYSRKAMGCGAYLENNHGRLSGSGLEISDEYCCTSAVSPPEYMRVFTLFIIPINIYPPLPLTGYGCPPWDMGGTLYVSELDWLGPG